MNITKATKTPHSKSSSTDLTHLFYDSVIELMQFSPEVLKRQREHEMFATNCLDVAIGMKQCEEAEREESEYEASKATYKAMQVEDIEQKLLAVLKKIAARDKAEERARLNTFTARALKHKAKSMQEKAGYEESKATNSAMHKKMAANIAETLTLLLRTPIGELLKLSPQDLRVVREQVLVALRWINGVIAMKTQEVNL